MGNTLLVAKAELKVSFRSRAFLILSGALILLVLLDMYGLLAAQITDTPVKMFVKEFDFNVVYGYMGVVVPLLALVVAVPSISMERAQGTLRLVLSQGVSDAELLVGKLIGDVVTVLSPLIVSIIIYVTLALWLFKVPSNDIVMSRVLLSTLNIALYAVAFVALGLMVSSIFKQTAVALVVAAVVFAIFAQLGTAIVGTLSLLYFGGLPSRIAVDLYKILIPLPAYWTQFYNPVYALEHTLGNLWPTGSLSFLQGSLANTGSTLTAEGTSFLSSNSEGYIVLAAYIVAAFALSVVVFTRSEK